MREHMGLFRGKRLCNGKWMTGDLLRHPDGTCFICHTGYRLNKYKVDPTTIGECTGLKDKNGKLIFEGDIVTIPSSKRAGLPAAIRYNRSGASFEIGRVGFNPISLWDAHEWCEIIGNATDNPELLKGGEG